MKFNVMRIFLLVAVMFASCAPSPRNVAANPSSGLEESGTEVTQTPPVGDTSEYTFPDAIDPAKQYLFYLYGKIIEEQGLPAISPEYGEYEYEAILQTLAGYGFVVISDVRQKGTDPEEYIQKVVGQITQLLEAGVPAERITVVGASMGAAMMVEISFFLRNPEVNFVLLGTCAPDMVDEWVQNQVYLYGNILSIRDEADSEYAGSCEELFANSEGKGIGRHEELILHVGTEHGILYKPLDEWITPTVEWAQQS